MSDTPTLLTVIAAELASVITLLCWIGFKVSRLVCQRGGGKRWERSEPLERWDFTPGSIEGKHRR